MAHVRKLSEEMRTSVRGKQNGSTTMLYLIRIVVAQVVINAVYIYHSQAKPLLEYHFSIQP